MSSRFEKLKRLLTAVVGSGGLLTLPLVAPAALVGAAAVMATPGAALAFCCKPPPPCCKPPSPPPQCCNGGHNINVPNVNVNVGATVIVNANATAVGVAGAAARGGAVAFGGGGSSVMFSPGNAGLIQGLDVQSGCCKQRASYSATRTKIRIVIIRAVCIDDRDVPHPASQVTPDRELAESYEGEIFRCIAGTRMQVTMSDYLGKIDFGPGETINCAKGEAINRTPAGEMKCLPQKPARDCNERSLLRRYGAGVKIIKIVTTETYTAYREESVEERTASTFSMTIDGGVGGIVH